MFSLGEFYEFCFCMFCCSGESLCSESPHSVGAVEALHNAESTFGAYKCTTSIGSVRGFRNLDLEYAGHAFFFQY